MLDLGWATILSNSEPRITSPINRIILEPGTMCFLILLDTFENQRIKKIRNVDKTPCESSSCTPFSWRKLWALSAFERERSAAKGSFREKRTTLQRNWRGRRFSSNGEPLEQETETRAARHGSGGGEAGEKGIIYWNKGIKPLLILSECGTATRSEEIGLKSSLELLWIERGGRNCPILSSFFLNGEPIKFLHGPTYWSFGLEL